MRLSVVIVNYNVKYFVEQCLNSLLWAIGDIEAEIFVVDNNSTDGSIEYLESRFNTVHFIGNKENVGFSKANNQAIRLAKGEYVLLLNPDTIVGDNLINDCLSLMESEPKAGGIGVKMYGADGKFAYESRRGFPSPATSFYKIIGLCHLFPSSERFGKYYLRYLNENEINRIDIISGACMFLRRSALDKAGLLDENFFMYGEDIDLSYRLTLAGYENYYIPSPIIHYKGESTKKDSIQYVYIFYNAMIIFFRKHFPHYSRLFTFAIKTVIYLRASFAVLNRLVARLGYKKKEPVPCFLVVGNDDTFTNISRICKDNKLRNNHNYVKVNDISTSKDFLNINFPADKYTHIVFDNSVFSYSRMIELLIYSASIYNWELGIYAAQTKILITPQQVYQ